MPLCPFLTPPTRPHRLPEPPGFARRNPVLLPPTGSASPFPYAALGSSLEKVRREPLRRRAIFAGSLPRCRRGARRRPERAGQGSRLPANPGRLRGGGRHRRAGGRGPSEPGRDSASCPWSRRPRSFQSRVSELERSHPGMLERSGRSRAALAGENEARRQGRRERRGSVPRCPGCSPPREAGGHGRDRAETRVPRCPQRRGRWVSPQREPLGAGPRGTEGARRGAALVLRGCEGHGGAAGLGHRRGSPAADPIPAGARSPSGEAGGSPAGSGGTSPRPGPSLQGMRGCRCFRAPLSAAPPAGTGRGPTPARRRRREGRGPGPLRPRSPPRSQPPQPRVPPAPGAPRAPRYLRAAPRAAVMPRAPRPPRAATAPAHWPPVAFHPAHWPHTAEPRPFPAAHWLPAPSPAPATLSATSRPRRPRPPP
ncbi:serine/arginine repetitive matrix protein 1-like [Passer domesticus]|uniref:serine/arginine repetitive matrix protein 1-like n=1 Tax=Passer domesticus TaxID=48849 RepID=UPI0030FF3B7D